MLLLQAGLLSAVIPITNAIKADQGEDKCNPTLDSCDKDIPDESQVEVELLDGLLKASPVSFDNVMYTTSTNNIGYSSLQPNIMQISAHDQ